VTVSTVCIRNPSTCKHLASIIRALAFSLWRRNVRSGLFVSCTAHAVFRQRCVCHYWLEAQSTPARQNPEHLSRQQQRQSLFTRPRFLLKLCFFAFLTARGKVSLHHAGRELRINDPKLGRLKVTREFVMHHAAKERASLRVDADFPVNLAGRGYCASVASLFWWLYALKVGIGLLSAGGVL